METKKEEVKKEKREQKNKKVNEKDKKIEELTNKVNELLEKNMRISAEMVNTIRRKEEENSKMLKYANEDIIKELLNICDNFERALNMEGDKNFLQGFKMIYDSLKNILTLNDVKEIEALGLEFDEKYHSAVMTEHIEGKTVNEVTEVLQKGYIYIDKVIRPAMVKVNK